LVHLLTNTANLFPFCSTARRILEFTELSGESSIQLTEHIVCVFEEAKVIDNVVSLSTGNSNSSFGGTKEEERIMSLKGSEIK
jgi:hypothetical protein